MDTLGKFKTNFLNRKNPFKVGFNNRSPFSYISSSGPPVPSSYDGGVPLVNFTPDQYAKAFDTTEAVKAEGEMYQKAGKAAGQLVSAVVAASGGGDIGKDGGTFMEKFQEGGKKGMFAKNTAGAGEDAVFESVLGQGFGDIGGGDGVVKFADMTLDNADPALKTAYYQWKNQQEKSMLGSTSYPNRNKGWAEFIEEYN